MNLLEEYAQNHGFKKKSVVYGGEWAGPCPRCGGNDRFIIWPFHPKSPGGRWFCRGCRADGVQHFSGDDVQFLVTFEGMEMRDAFREVGREMPARPASTWQASRPVARVSSSSSPFDPARWRAAAEAFVAGAERRMVPDSPAYAHAMERGFRPDVIRWSRMGYVAGWTQHRYSDWGLLPPAGKDDLFKVPGPALVIPGFLPDGRICRIKLRKLRPDAFGKHYRLPGSSQNHVLAGEGGRRPLVIAEAEICATLIFQECGDFADAMSMSGMSSHLDPHAVELVRRAPLILEALDADEGGDKCRAMLRRAGVEDLQHLPIPAGKDPTEYSQQGGNLRTWVAGSLPASMRGIVRCGGFLNTATGQAENLTASERELVKTHYF